MFIHIRINIPHGKIRFGSRIRQVLQLHTQMSILDINVPKESLPGGSYFNIAGLRTENKVFFRSKGHVLHSHQVTVFVFWKRQKVWTTRYPPLTRRLLQYPPK